MTYLLTIIVWTFILIGLALRDKSFKELFTKFLAGKISQLLRTSDQKKPQYPVKYGEYYHNYHKRRQHERHKRRIFDDIIFNSEVEAIMVAEQIKTLAKSYDEVTLKDYYELVGVGSCYLDTKYGWTWDTLKDYNPAISKTFKGFKLNLPHVEELNPMDLNNSRE